MAQYIVPQTGFIEITETSGTIQNDSAIVVEITNTQEANSGIRLYPHESKSFDPLPKYARAVGGKGPAVLRVVTFMETVPDGDGGDVPEEDIATDQEVEDMLDNVFPVNETAEAGAGEDSVEGGGPSLDD